MTDAIDDPSRPLTQADLNELRDLLARLDAAAPSPVAPIPFDRFAAELLSSYTTATHARSTIVRMKQTMALVAELVGPTGTTGDLTGDLLARFTASRPAAESPHTTNGLLRAIRVACNRAVAGHYLAISPFALRKPFVRVGPATAARRRHHSLEDIARVLSLARADIDRKLPGSPSQWRARRLFALVAIVAYTGVRRNEALYLRVEDIDLPGRTIHIVPRVGNRLKTSASAQPVPMTEALAVVLADWIPFLAIDPGFAATPALWTTSANPEGERDAAWVVPNMDRTAPWTGGPSKIGRPIDRIKRLGARAGVEGFTFLSLRHSWATHAEGAWGLTELQIRRVLRHTSVETQQHYRHADMTNLRRAIADVGFGGEPPAVAPTIADSAPARPSPPLKPKGAYHAPKLDDDDVAEMRELRQRGWTYTALLVRYRVARSTLHAALHGLTHRDVPMPPGADGE